MFEGILKALEIEVDFCASMEGERREIDLRVDSVENGTISVVNIMGMVQKGRQLCWKNKDFEVKVVKFEVGKVVKMISF